MAAHSKLPTFKGAGDEDLERFWFVVESVWTSQNIMSDSIKQVQRSLAFERRTQDWYKGYIGQHASTTIEEIKKSLNH